MGTFLAHGRLIVCLAGIGLCASPALATQPAGWYLAMARGAVGLVDPLTNRLFLSGNTGTDLALSPDRTRLFVASWDVLIGLDARTMATLSGMSAPDKRGFGRFAISPDGTRAAVATTAEVLVFDLAAEQLVGTVLVGQVDLTKVGGIAYSPDGQLVYAAASFRSHSSPQQNGALVVINASTFQIERSIALRGPARHVALSADGSIGYVASGPHLHEIDLMGRGLQHSLDLDADANDIVIAPDGRRLYLTANHAHDGDGPWLITVDRDSFAIVDRRQLAACGEARRLAIGDDGRALAVVVSHLNVVISIDLDGGSARIVRTPHTPVAILAADWKPPIDAALEDLLVAVPHDQLFSCDATIAIDDVSGAPGEIVDVPVSIDGARGPGIAGIQNEIIFDPSRLVLGSARACSLDHANGDTLSDCDNPDVTAPCKELFATTIPCTERSTTCPANLHDWMVIRNLVMSLSNTNTMPIGVVYRCRFRIPADAIPGTSIPLLCETVGASTPEGDAVPVTCSDGRITIVNPVEPSPTAAPTPTATSIIEQPRDQVVSEVTTTSFPGGCQVADPVEGGTLSLLTLLLLPLLTISLRTMPQPEVITRLRRAAARLPRIKMIVVVFVLVSNGAHRSTAQPTPAAHGWYVTTETFSRVESVEPLHEIIRLSEALAVPEVRDLALSADRTRLYVVSAVGLAVLDPSTLSVISTINDLAFHPFYRLALSPDGTQAAVSDGHGAVSFFDLMDERLLGTSPLWTPSFTGLEGLTYSPDGRFVYATTSAPSSEGFQGETGSVVIFDAVTHQVDGVIETGRAAHHIVVTADGETGYVAGGLSLTEVDLVRRTVRRTLYLDSPASDVALAPDERHAYVTGFHNSGTRAPWLISIHLDSYSVIERRQLAGCGNSRRVAVAPDGRSLAVVIQDLDVLIVVDLEAGTSKAVRTGGRPFGIVAAGWHDPPAAATAAEVVSSDRLFSCDARLSIEQTFGAPGETVEVTIRGESGLGIAGIQNDILFDPALVTLDHDADCRIDAALGDRLQGCQEGFGTLPCKELYTNTLACGSAAACPAESWSRFRAVVLSLSNVRSIPAGPMYHCRFHIRPEAAPGTNVALLCDNTAASTASAAAEIPVACGDGQITIVNPGEPTPVLATPPTPTIAATTPIVERPRDQVASDVETSTSGCRIAQTRVGDSTALWLAPLLVLVLRSRAQRRPGWAIRGRARRRRAVYPDHERSIPRQPSR